MDRTYILEYWSDEGWFVGRLKDIPSVFSQGKTLKELEENVKEVYHLMMTDEQIEIPHKIHRKELQIRV